MPPLDAIRRELASLVGARVLCDLSDKEQARYLELCREERALLGWPPEPAPPNGTARRTTSETG